MARNKKKPEFLSALGVMFEIWKAVVDAVLAKGGSDDDLRRVKDDKKLADAIADLIVGVKKKLLPRSFADLLVACKQYHNSINEKKFPLEPVSPEEDDWEVYEHHYTSNVNGTGFLNDIEKLGYRPCGLRRAMEYIADGHQDDQLDHPIVVTTAVEHRDMYNQFRGWIVPIFTEEAGGRRSLISGVIGLDSCFKPGDVWLVLRKKNQ